MPCRESFIPKAAIPAALVFTIEQFDHQPPFRLDQIDISIGGRHEMIGNTERPLRTAHRQTPPCQYLERPARALVNELPINIEQNLPVFTRDDLVGVPDSSETASRALFSLPPSSRQSLARSIPPLEEI